MSWGFDQHEGLKYRTLLPPGYAPQQRRYPLVIFLHGSGERGDDGQSHLKNGVESFEGQQAIVVAPQCPLNDTWGGSWYGGDSATQRTLISLVRELSTRRSVDPLRISVIGYSMGAIGLWAILERHHDLFAAGVAIAGDLHPESARGLVQFPIWAFHGARDRAVPITATRAVAAWMQTVGGRMRFTELADVGHDSWKHAFATPELMPWLLSQHR